MGWAGVGRKVPVWERAQALTHRTEKGVRRQSLTLHVEPRRWERTGV